MTRAQSYYAVVSPAAIAFGPFQLDERSSVLRRDGASLPVTDRHASLLRVLAAHTGTVLSKDALVAVCWGGVAVTDNSVEQAISRLRRVLGLRADGRPYIETVPGRGYRFTEEVRHVATREAPAAVDALLVPQRAWLEGRDALETLNRTQVATAMAAFRDVLVVQPDDVLAHLGFANASLFRFESTRIDVHPDTTALADARHHADEACRLDPESGEAWATLAFILHSAGDANSAAAARRAVSLEPNNWRHSLRLALVSWGEARLRAAEHTLRLLHGLALAHWLAATVHVARQAFAEAERHLDAGAVAQDAQCGHVTRFGAVGLHWLRGLVRLHHGDDEGAREAFERELTFESGGHLYARECCANTWYALGALFLRQGSRDDALRAFEEALRRVDNHLPAVAAKTSLGGEDSAALDRATAQRLTHSQYTAARLEAAVAQAVCHARRGEPQRAATIVGDALRQVGPGATGWAIPLEPMLAISTRRELWIGVLTALRTRAV